MYVPPSAADSWKQNTKQIQVIIIINYAGIIIVFHFTTTISMLRLYMHSQARPSML